MRKKIPICTAIIAVLLFPFLSSVEVHAEKKSTISELSAEQKDELKKAEAILSKELTPYQKGKFTKILNKGAKEEVLEFPGVGEATARRIIEARPFKSSAHLVFVKGIGLKTFAEIAKSMK